MGPPTGVSIAADKVASWCSRRLAARGLSMNSYLRIASLSAALLMLLGAAPARADITYGFQHFQSV